MNKHIDKMGKWYILVTFGVSLYVQLQNIDTLMSLAGKLLSIFTPFIYGLGIAYLIDVLVRWLTSKYLKNKRGLAIFISYVLFITTIILILCAIIPQQTQSILGILNNLDYYKTIIDEGLNIVNNDFGTELCIEELLGSQQSKQIISELIQKYQQNVVNTVSQFIQTQITILTAFAASIYIILDKYKLKEQTIRLMNTFLNKKTTDFICKVAKIFDRQTTNFLIGKILDSLIIGILTFILMYILVLPYQMLIATIVGITNIIPVFGPFIGAIPGILIIFLESPIQSLWFTVLILIIQQLDGNFIGPKILGQTQSVQAFWILFSIVVGGSLAGVLGMLLGVPIFIVIQTLLNEYQQQKIDKDSIT